MTELPHTTHVKEIERLVEHLNEDLANKDFESLAEYYHNHAAMVESGTHRRLIGADEIIENYRDFIEDAEVSDFKITEMIVDLFSETAVAFFTYRIKYSVESTKYDEHNTEILVFRQHDEHWQIIWRTQMLGQ